MDIPILCYHRIDKPDPRTTLCVSVQSFDEQMAYLAKNGYKVVSLEDIILHKKGRIELPYKSVAITFDDGYLDNYNNAFPILKKYGFTATIFIVAGLVGKTNKWDESPSFPAVELMDWQQICQMSACGITFGSHGLNHKPLSKPKFLLRLPFEIGLSKNIIENKIHRPVNFFGYPYGRDNYIVEVFVKAHGYKGACIVNKRSFNDKTDSSPYRLKRVEINTVRSSIDEFIKVIELATSPRLNILQVCTHYAGGGQEIYSARLAMKLKEAGHNVIFVLRRDGFLNDYCKDSGLTVEFARIRSALDLKSIFTLIKLIKKHNIDIVHGHIAKEYWAIVIAAGLTHIKVVLTRHLIIPFNRTTHWIAKKANSIIAVSEAVKDTIVRENIIPQEKIKVIYNGVDTNLFSPASGLEIDEIRKYYGFDKDDFIIGNVGHMGCKGQYEIIMAMEDVCKKYPNIKCIFVSETSTVPLYEKLASKLGIRNNIFFKGFQKDISKIMKMIDLFCIMPSIEAFGIVIIEAMACARPVIGANTGGIKEIINDNVTGFLVFREDIKALSKAITFMIENKKEAAMMGLEGCNLVKRKFDLKDHISRTEEVYYQILLKAGN